MLAYGKPMSFSFSFPFPSISLLFLFTVSLSPFLVAAHNDDNKIFTEGPVKLEMFHRHHPDVSDKLHGENKPESLIDRLRDLHDQDHKRNKLVSKTLLHHRARMLDETTSLSSPIALKMHSGADYGNGQYFVHIKVGTPPQKFMLVADTGSELTWMKCRYRRCIGNCSAHHNHKNRFDPAMKFEKAFLANRSSSFKTVDCSSQMCKSSFAKLFSIAQCPTPTSPCIYDYRYLDGTSALGIFANETITVGLTNGKTTELHNAIIGCTESLAGRVFTGSDGVMGLSNSAFSFAQEFSTGGFSYCLVDHLSSKNATNYFIFGKPAPSSNPDITFTELNLGGLYGNFYGVDLIGISIDGKMLDIPPSVWDIESGGGTVIDSGTSLTLLSTPAYGVVMNALSSHLSTLPRITMPPFEFCFNDTEYSASTMAPKMGFHFKDGAIFEPPAKSYIISTALETSCIGFSPLDSPASNIIGNILQQNHLWQFDLVERKVGFAPSSCT